MKYLHLTATIFTMGLLAACSEATTETVAQTTETAAEKVEVMADQAGNMTEIISEVPSGTYKSDSGHAYIAFTYSHQGYSNPIVRWGDFEATLELDNEAPENSTLSVNIDAASVDSGVDDFNDHLKSADFFDVTKHPNIAFTSTELDQVSAKKGTLTGELTMHGVTHPLTLDVTLNKAGKTRNGTPKFGISATGELNRTDWGIDTYAPMAENVTLMIEVEFEKAE